jgi:hypothetical protein
VKGAQRTEPWVRFTVKSVAESDEHCCSLSGSASHVIC